MIKKLIAVTAAIATTVAVSSAAFAQTYVDSVSAEFDTTTQTVSATVPGVTFSNQITVVITEVGAESIDESNIFYIDQGSDGSVLTNMGMMESVIEEGQTYEIRVGCSEGDIYVGTFVAGQQAVAYKKGDVDNDGTVAMNDVLAVLNHYLGVTLIDDNSAFSAGDTDSDGTIAMNDVLAVLNHYLGVTLLWN